MSCQMFRAMLQFVVADLFGDRKPNFTIPLFIQIVCANG